jgi:hypothetical protein
VVVAGTLYYVRAAWGRGRPAPREGAYDSVTYRSDSADCGMALLAIQQGLGVLPERQPGTDPGYFADPSSRRAVVEPPGGDLLSTCANHRMCPDTHGHFCSGTICPVVASLR